MADEAGDVRSSFRVSSVQRAIEGRVANPLFRGVLRSRAHWPASRWLVLVSYVGRRSGRRYTFPVAYARVDDAVVAVTPREESNWWRNFRDARECRVWLRGAERTATGELVRGDERGPLLAAYFRTHRLLGRVLGGETAPTTPPDRLARANRDLAVVRFALDGRARESH